jgi:Transposase
MQSMTDVIGTVHAGELAWTVGIDLGRRAAHEAVLRAPDGSERRTRFAHSRDGIDGFVGELSELRGRVLVIIEPTATRWQALAEELSGQGIEVRQVNAATVAKLRGARDITGAKPIVWMPAPSPAPWTTPILCAPIPRCCLARTRCVSSGCDCAASAAGFAARSRLAWTRSGPSFCRPSAVVSEASPHAL